MGMCFDMRMDLCMDMCMYMCVGMCINMCIDMCIGKSIDMCIDHYINRAVCDADIRGRCIDPPTWAVETSGKFKGYYKESRCFFVLLRFVVFVNSKGGACRPWCWILVLAYIVMA